MNAGIIPLEEQAELRRKLRAERCAFPASTRSVAALAVCNHLVGTALFAEAESIAAYLAVNGEMDARPIMERAWAAGKTVYVPVVRGGRGTPLEFRIITPGTTLSTNRYGIPEPATAAAEIDPRNFDLVLCPVVAFDDQGTRIGMGGGYYDATFAFRQDPANGTPPMLGIAYSAQHVARLARNAWDVPLDGVATEEGLTWFQP